MTPEDSLAVSMLAILVLAGATVATIFISLIKNAGKKDELEELLTENEPVYQDSKKAATNPPQAEEWVKDPDWWRS